jgi:hypothetical protein
LKFFTWQLSRKINIDQIYDPGWLSWCNKFLKLTNAKNMPPREVKQMFITERTREMRNDSANGIPTCANKKTKIPCSPPNPAMEIGIRRLKTTKGMNAKNRCRGMSKFKANETV